MIVVLICLDALFYKNPVRVVKMGAAPLAFPIENDYIHLALVEKNGQLSMLSLKSNRRIRFVFSVKKHQSCAIDNTYRHLRH